MVGQVYGKIRDSKQDKMMMNKIFTAKKSDYSVDTTAIERKINKLMHMHYELTK